MKPYLLKETTWKTIQEIDFDLAVLPCGAIRAVEEGKISGQVRARRGPGHHCGHASRSGHRGQRRPKAGYGSVERGLVDSRRCATDLYKVTEDALDLNDVLDYRDHLHLRTALKDVNHALFAGVREI